MLFWKCQRFVNQFACFISAHLTVARGAVLLAGDTSSRIQMTVRLKVEDKDFFSVNTEACGIEASVAARQILELVIQRMRAGADYLDALHELKSTWRVPVGDRLGKSAKDGSLADRVERLETELRSGRRFKKVRAS